MSDAIPLPPRPNLEQYKKLTKDFQQACKSSDPGAIRQCATHWAGTLTRLQGIEITTQARREIDRKAERIEQRWHEFKKSHERASRCALADAQFFLAREHGFTSWPKFARHVQALARAHSPVSNFEAAADAIVSGDAATLRKLLRDSPELARERSTREHRSTLLHYVSANGVEDFRQKTPANIVEITRLLLDAGAAVDAQSDAYGGCTALGLVATSIHPEQAGVQIALLQTLLDRGARLDHPSAGGNRHPLINACLANGQPNAAEFLASLGAPIDLEAAAALGRLDIVKRYFDENGVLQPGANREQMESAFLYACGYGREETVGFLLEHGVDPGLQNSDGETGLHWAAYGPDVDMARFLLQRGAPVDVKENRFHATPLDMALWAWTNSSDSAARSAAGDAAREHCYEFIALLTRAGAKLDPQHWQDPGGERPGMLEKIHSDPRMLAALRGEISS
jgi:ankyrin repeat protein